MKNYDICSAVPHPTAPPRAPFCWGWKFNFKEGLLGPSLTFDV